MAVTAPILTLPQLAQFSGGDLWVRAVPGEARAREAWLASGVEGVSIDTRTLRAGDLFVPLAGGNTDGHAFIGEAFTRGAAAALCDRAHAAEWSGRSEGPLVIVDEVTSGLQRLAARHRERWAGPLLAVTGSSGKTTMKDLVAAVLGAVQPVLRSAGNLNNHWGVPITLLGLRAEHRAAVVEMGMNHEGELALLTAIARPNAAIVTNAGSAHLEHLGSLEAIAREKASVAYALAPHEVVFAGADSPRLLDALRGVRCRRVTFGFAADADVRPAAVEDLGAAGSRLWVEGFPDFILPLPGRHLVANALGALAVAREYGVPPAAATAALALAQMGEGRMEIRLARGATLIVDCYNANPESTAAALVTLEHWPGAERRIAALGDMLELGGEAPRLHAETAAAAGRGSELWVTGAFADDWARGARGAGRTVRVFATRDRLREALHAALADGVVVLVKASRGARFEQLLTGLETEG
ncbi:MAG: UDP-N-acetylmuramoyl-tripeptide--D-alanyl-D-alanine ligase [Candidatus Eisenbacteria bacterium]